VSSESEGTVEFFSRAATNPNFVNRCVLYDVARDESVVTPICDCPENVDFTNVRSFLEQQFGGPLTPAWTHHDRDAEIDVGWTFAAPGQAGFEIIAVPMIRDAVTGELVDAFIWPADQRELAETISKEHGIDLPIITAAHQEWKPADGGIR